MLKYRLLIGVPLALVFVGLLLADGYVDGSWTADPGDDRPLQGTAFFVLIAACQVLAHVELRDLLRARGLDLPLSLALPGALLCVTAAYLQPLLVGGPWIGLALAGAWLGGLGPYYRRHGWDRMLRDWGAVSFSLIYLGLLGAFAVRLRGAYGVWALFMFVATVKLSDVGAYTAGRLWGRHRCAPRLSPGKTWEGLAGAVVTAALAALVFSLASGQRLMPWPVALGFGAVLALVGQGGDLIESMLKRAAAVKDSSCRIPGFGGVLDLLDSPLAAAPVAYLVFALVAGCAG